eukprot:scaffold32026_cov51-Attheya_sp.AAC.2
MVSAGSFCKRSRSASSRGLVCCLRGDDNASSFVAHEDEKKETAGFFFVVALIAVVLLPNTAMQARRFTMPTGWMIGVIIVSLLRFVSTNEIYFRA